MRTVVFSPVAPPTLLDDGIFDILNQVAAESTVEIALARATVMPNDLRQLAQLNIDADALVVFDNECANVGPAVAVLSDLTLPTLLLVSGSLIEPRETFQRGRCVCAGLFKIDDARAPFAAFLDGMKYPSPSESSHSSFPFSESAKNALVALRERFEMEATFALGVDASLDERYPEARTLLMDDPQAACRVSFRDVVSRLSIFDAQYSRLTEIRRLGAALTKAQADAFYTAATTDNWSLGDVYFLAEKATEEMQDSLIRRTDRNSPEGWRSFREYFKG